ncbi:leishmanolysin [Pelagimonas varians]|uniref:Leishmanolysin n=1 Tax=Pelagimonas varians TaxID=696760 RepID=A0A238JU19_9RHOB|nr:leishmanolysin [Pelagimonas varians]SMX34120.1 Leishmanolysin [Pelagimonas varians]
MAFLRLMRSDFFTALVPFEEVFSNGRRALPDPPTAEVFEIQYDVSRPVLENDTDVPPPIEVDLSGIGDEERDFNPALLEPHYDADHFEFVGNSDADVPAFSGQGATGPTEPDFTPVTMVAVSGDGRGDPDPEPDPAVVEDNDPDPAPEPVVQPNTPAAPTDMGRSSGATAGTPYDSPRTPAPGDDNAVYGRAPDATPEVIPDSGPVTTYTSGGAAATSYNVTIDFTGTWTTQLQAAFIDAADYLSTIILADIPDVIVDGLPVDDITITATLEAIDGVGGTLGSAGPRDVRFDGTYLASTGAMTFDSADASNQFGIGNWETIVLHEMLHAMGFGTLWSYMGLTSGSVASGDMRFTGVNASETYLIEFPGVAASDLGSALGVPIETDGGAGTAGGHWDEVLFDTEIMTGYVDPDSFVSDMTIAALEDMGYDTVFDNPYDGIDLFGPTPANPLADLFA